MTRLFCLVGSFSILLLACAVSACLPVRPASPSSAAVVAPPEPVPLAPLPAPRLIRLTGGTMPGDRVAWAPAPAQRGAPAGVGAFLADVDAALRSRYGYPAFYPGGGKCAVVDAPRITLGDVAAALPPRFRGTRYNTYLVAQRRQWDREPLYVWDEWVAYDNGTAAGIEAGGRPGPGTSDDAVACIELSGYALAVAAAARQKGVPTSEQFREFLAWELRRSLDLYARAIALPVFAWPDRRLEQLWRGGDAFVVENLRALYGDALTVNDLLPHLPRAAAGAPATLP